ncbi:SRPBCC domain-containing protein [Arthrospiribacter ruber]|jgi:uncharacterized protein YndB with AHSA1/START domain|uniref:ATPase n=1 Tax=Arthrospiribacter ruber TaxID=2487934 RepID=A0A951ITN8_9BACT|nr:SRPBCC domain-containing protein [Arthrospiribacter ruber]MBW3467190.1 ATPase [Arthrospiribacter ruber]
MDQLRISTALQVGSTSDKVFKAIIDPEKMKNYFISHGTAMMQQGETVEWEFPEFPGAFPVRVLEVTENQKIIFEWDGDSKALTVEIRLEAVNDGLATVVYVDEYGMENTAEGINWLKGNTAGWANFLACLKAYLEFGINLRKGGFDFMKKSDQ